MKKKIFAVFATMLTAVVLNFSVSAQSTEKNAVEECVNNRTKCVVCGGSCIVNCCDAPAGPVGPPVGRPATTLQPGY